MALTVLCYFRQNDTNSGKDDVFTKFLTTLQSDQQPSSTLDSSTHPRVRRFTLSLETLLSSLEDLPERSKCRWTYRYNTDPNRLPRTLFEAQCSQLYLPGVAGQCEHVYYYVPVRRKNESGTWINDWQWLRVGCTLARPIIAPPITFD